MSEREAWLSKAVVAINAEVFIPLKLPMVEKWAISCGWVKGSSAKAVATCVDPVCSVDGITELFVAPTEIGAINVLGHITHEMIHAIVGQDQKHDGNFIVVCRALDMVPPWTKTGPVPGTKCGQAMERIAALLGPYPHSALVPRKKPSPGVSEHRWISRKEPKWGVLVSTGNVVKFGRPKDPWGEDCIPKYPERVFGAAPVNPMFKDMYEHPREKPKAGASTASEFGSDTPEDDEDSDA